MKKPTPEVIFYYNFKTNYVWLVLTSVLLIFMIYCTWCHPFIIYWWQTWGLIGSLIYSLVLWCIKYLRKHKMAVINDKYIKIDHCRPLPWRMVAFAELKIVRCCFKKLPIIVIRTKKPLHYKFNLMQKLCAKSDFTPFSIALYALKSEDANLIAAIISRKIALLG